MKASILEYKLERQNERVKYIYLISTPSKYIPSKYPSKIIIPWPTEGWTLLEEGEIKIIIVVNTPWKLICCYVQKKILKKRKKKKSLYACKQTNKLQHVNNFRFPTVSINYISN